MASRLVSLAAPLLLVPTFAAACETGSCFGGTTWISLQRGRKRLGDVQVGDVVQSFDVATGRLVESPVLRVFRHGRKAVGQLQSRLGAGPRSVTGNHPIFLEPEGTFAAAGDLGARHAKRRGLHWDDQELRAMELEPYRAAPLGHLLEVYNLSIEGTETYFADGLLVHNKSDGAQSGGAAAVGGSGTGGFPFATGGQTNTGGAPSSGGAAGASGSAGEGGSAGAAGAEP